MLVWFMRQDSGLRQLSVDTPCIARCVRNGCVGVVHETRFRAAPVVCRHALYSTLCEERMC